MGTTDDREVEATRGVNSEPPGLIMMGTVMVLSTPPISMLSRLTVIFGVLLTAPSLILAQPSDADLVEALQRGGHVILMRHAASPHDAPDAATANADNPNRERQLDQEGRETAKAMGEALRRLEIPVGPVLSSPTYRALETARYLDLGEPHPQPELGNDPKGMRGGTEAQAAWLRGRVKEFDSETNILLITHMPNIRDAFPEDAAGLADGEALVFGPDGSGGARLVRRVKIDQWPSFLRQ